MNPCVAKPLLILSDEKPGHVNQSIAFARHLNRDYVVRRVAFKSRAAKGFSYLADRCGLYLDGLFRAEELKGSYAAIVSAGSETYYANRTTARRLGIPSVAIMLPQGYRFDFDLIVAQQHDNPPERENIISLPINLTYVEPQGIVQPELGRKYIAVIIGGDSKREKLEADILREVLERIFVLFSDYDFWLTTSRRTSAAVEMMLSKFNWSRAVYYSREKINPIADFLQHSDYVFLTADSSSMISEAVSFGSSYVEMLPLSNAQSKRGKLDRMISQLESCNSLHWFSGETGEANVKIDLASDFLKSSTFF